MVSLDCWHLGAVCGWSSCPVRAGGGPGGQRKNELSTQAAARSRRRCARL